MPKRKPKRTQKRIQLVPFSALQKGSFEAKDGRGSRLSETPIFVVFSVWELEDEEREKKTNYENEELRFRKIPNTYKTRDAYFEGCGIIAGHADDPASLIGISKNRPKPLFLLCKMGRVPLFNGGASRCLTRFCAKCVLPIDSSGYMYVYIYIYIYVWQRPQKTDVFLAENCKKCPEK